MKVAAAFLAALALFVAVALQPAHAQAATQTKYITIAELYDQTRSGWHAAYTAPEHEQYGGVPAGYTFTVDVPIEVPDVAACPVFDLSINKAVLKDETFIPIIEGQVIDNGNTNSITLYGWDENSRPYGIFFSADLYPITANGQAENNPLTIEDAKAFFQKQVQKYFGVEDVVILAAAGSAVTPEFQETDVDEMTRQLHPPLSKGVYQMEARQTFGGIPLLDARGYYKRYFPNVQLTMQLMDESAYALEGTTMKREAVVYDDAPLLPWRNIQRVYETECLNQNRMYDVYAVRLGYQLTITRKGKNTGLISGDWLRYPEGTFDELYTTRPVWVIYGYAPLKISGMLQGEQYEYERERFENRHGAGSLFMAASHAVIIDAQTGELYELDGDPAKVPPVAPMPMSWEAVR